MISFEYKTNLLDLKGKPKFLYVEANDDGTGIIILDGSNPVDPETIPPKDSKAIKDQIQDWVIHYRIMSSHPAAMEANYVDWIKGWSR